VPEQVDITAAVADALATTAAHLTGPVLGNSFDVNMGLSGMARLVADLRDGQTRKGWRKRFGDHRAYAFGRRARRPHRVHYGLRTAGGQ
jgi:hypothetical protein